MLKYQVRSRWWLAAAAVLVLSACHKGGDNVGGDGRAPEVTGVTPANGASDAAIETTLSATFNEILNASTVNAASFTLTGPSGNVAGTVSYTGTTATFTPTANLDYSSSYTVTLTTAIQDLAGNALAASSVWTFTTLPMPDTTAPTITGVSPVNNATAIEPGSAVTADFSETMNSSTLSTSTFIVSGPGGAVAGSVGYSGTTATFTPSSTLETNASFTATITTGAQDVAGNGLTASYIWGFTTRPWTRQLGSAADDRGYSLATDASGNVFVAGHTDGALDGNTSAGYFDSFVVKYNSVGVKQWTRQLGTAGVEVGNGIAIDSSGNVFVTGYTTGGLDGNTNAGNSDLFLVKYDGAGVKQWTRQLGTSTDDFAQSVATDINGNIFVTGFTVGGLDGNTNAGTNSYDLFIVKYDTNGLKQWTRQLGTMLNDIGYSVTTDTNGNIFVAGVTTGSLDGNLSAGGNDVFVVKYDGAGMKQWTRQLGTPANDGEFGIGAATDTNGNVYVTGNTSGDLDGNTNAGSLDLFLVKYDNEGVKQWTRQLGMTTGEYGQNVAIDPNNNIYVTGNTFGSLDGNTYAGDVDAFVVKYDSAGTKQWTRQFGTPVSDFNRGGAVDVSGNVYVTGHTTGNLDGITNAGGPDLFIVKYSADGTRR